MAKLIGREKRECTFEEKQKCHWRKTAEIRQNGKIASLCLPQFPVTSATIIGNPHDNYSPNPAFKVAWKISLFLLT